MSLSPCISACKVPLTLYKTLLTELEHSKTQLCCRKEKGDILALSYEIYFFFFHEAEDTTHGSTL